MNIQANAKAIHIAKSHSANCTSQNLSKSMSLPTLTNMLTKLKELNGMREALGTTFCISNGRESAKYQGS
jgi:hypothetical protein